MIDLQNKIVLFDVESTPLFSTTHSFLNIEAIILSQTMRCAVGTGGLLVFLALESPKSPSLCQLGKSEVFTVFLILKYQN